MAIYLTIIFYLKKKKPWVVFELLVEY
jgi:hypothetical protein